MSRTRTSQSSGRMSRFAFGLPFVEVDCFSRTDPVEVPASTLLSQLV